MSSKFVPVIYATDNLYPDNPLPDRILACTNCGTVVFTDFKDKHICLVMDTSSWRKIVGVGEDL